MPATWSSMVGKGWAVDGDKDGRYDIYDPDDAFPTAAVYLCKSGATSSEGIRKALWHYNHSTAYVNHVSRLSWAYAAAYPHTGSAYPPGTQPAPSGMPAFSNIRMPFRRESGGMQVVATARRYLGTPYRWGSTDPNVGLDCSALVQLVYRQHGVSLPRVSGDQARIGSEVDGLVHARPGDLLFFAGRINHIGIYVGDGRMLHAPRTGGVVKISAVWKTPTTIRRVLTKSDPSASPTPSVQVRKPFAGGRSALHTFGTEAPSVYTDLPTAELAESVGQELAATTVVVEAGDSLWALSERFAAEGGQGHNRWTKLYQLNEEPVGADPGLLTVGTTLQLPAGWST